MSHTRVCDRFHHRLVPSSSVFTLLVPSRRARAPPNSSKGPMHSHKQHVVAHMIVAEDEAMVVDNVKPLWDLGNTGGGGRVPRADDGDSNECSADEHQQQGEFIGPRCSIVNEAASYVCERFDPDMRHRAFKMENVRRSIANATIWSTLAAVHTCVRAHATSVLSARSQSCLT